MGLSVVHSIDIYICIISKLQTCLCDGINSVMCSDIGIDASGIACLNRIFPGCAQTRCIRGHWDLKSTDLIFSQLSMNDRCRIIKRLKLRPIDTCFVVHWNHKLCGFDRECVIFACILFIGAGIEIVSFLHIPINRVCSGFCRNCIRPLCITLFLIFEFHLAECGFSLGRNSRVAIVPVIYRIAINAVFGFCHSKCRRLIFDAVIFIRR